MTLIFAGWRRGLPVLVAKLAGYDDLARTTGRVYPVLFSLHSEIREQHLHQWLTDAGIRYYPVATATRNPAAGLSPAEAVWRLHHHPGLPRRLTELPASAPPAVSPSAT